MADFKNVKEASEAYEKLLEENKKLIADQEEKSKKDQENREKLVAENNKQSEMIGVIQSHLDAAKARINELESDLSDKSILIGKQEEQIEELMETLSRVRTEKPKAGEKPSFIHENGKEYEIQIPRFNLDGVVHTAESLLDNKKLQSKLIEMESDILCEKK